MRAKRNMKVIVLLAAMACAAGVVQASIIISDTFSRDGVLNGTSPDIGTGTWIVPEWPGATVTTNGVLPAFSSGRFNLGFNFVSNRVYTLTADIDVQNGLTTKWMGMGFSTDTGATMADLGSAYAWMRIDSDGFGKAAPGYSTGNLMSYGAAELTNTVSFKIVLDTSVSDWTAKFYLDDVLVAEPASSKTPDDAPITGIFFGASSGAAGTFDNLKLTDDVIPEPATVGMLGLGALITIVFRRMRTT